MKPRYLTVHTSATYPWQDIGAEEIAAMHRRKGWRTIGYHFVIRRDGTIDDGRPITQQGAHVRGHNRNNVGICLVGGLDDEGNAIDNFTVEQMDSLRYLITKLQVKYRIRDERIKGHRDWFPDLNGDGVIDQHDWLKECPCFDVRVRLEEWRK